MPRKAIPHKVMILLTLGLGIVIMGGILFFFHIFSQPSTRYEPLPLEPSADITWFFVTQNENTTLDTIAFYPQAELERLAGGPIRFVCGTVNKFLNMMAAGEDIHIVTSMYMEPLLKRFETSGQAISIHKILREQAPEFALSPVFLRWYSNENGQVFSCPHIPITKESLQRSAGFTMLANKELMEKYGVNPTQFTYTEQMLDTLKIIRKNEPGVIPCYMDLIVLQQMFGVVEEDENGVWQDPLLHPQSLEALELMNRMYRERYLQGAALTWTREQVLETLLDGRLFMAAANRLDELTAQLPADSPLFETYVPVGPLRSQTGSEPAFYANYDGDYPSTIFIAEHGNQRGYANLILFFYGQIMELETAEADFLQMRGIPIDINYAGLMPNEAFENSCIQYYSNRSYRRRPYELLLSYYANTTLARLEENRQSYLHTQLNRMILAGTPGALPSLYHETCATISGPEYELIILWKQAQYAKSWEIYNPVDAEN